MRTVPGTGPFVIQDLPFVQRLGERILGLACTAFACTNTNTMRSTPIIVTASVIAAVFVACSRQVDQTAQVGTPLAFHEEEPPPGIAEFKNGEAEPASPSSSAARADNDGKRRMIRTANIRFRVKDAVQSTYAIEDIVRRFDGLVTNTELRSQVDRTQNIPIAEDSLVELVHYTMVNQLTFRVPNHRLDTVLKSLAGQVDFMDHRTINANDVALELLRNQLAQSRIAKHEQRVEGAIDEQGRKLKETLPAEDQLLDKQASSDEALLANLGMEDRIAYSTVTLDLYQRPSTRATALASPPHIEPWSRGFVAQFKASAMDGWAVVEWLLLALIKGWSVIALTAVGWLVWRKTRRARQHIASV